MWKKEGCRHCGATEDLVQDECKNGIECRRRETTQERGYGKAILVAVVACVIFAAGLGVALAAKPPEPPGKNPCEHGNAQKPCRDDPQPNHGADCKPHGKGGENEDHCKQTTETTTTTQTTTTETTTTGTTTTTTTSPPTTTTTTQPPTTTTQTTETTTTQPPPPPPTTTTTTTTTQPPSTTETTQTTPSAPPPTQKPPTKPKPKPRPTPRSHKPPPVCPPGGVTTERCGVQGSG